VSKDAAQIKILHYRQCIAQPDLRRMGVEIN
jgi:hypothetical protein